MSTLTHSEEVLTHLDAPDRPFLNRTAPELVTLFLGLVGGLSRLHQADVAVPLRLAEAVAIVATLAVVALYRPHGRSLAVWARLAWRHWRGVRLWVRDPRDAGGLAGTTETDLSDGVVLPPPHLAALGLIPPTGPEGKRAAHGAPPNPTPSRDAASPTHVPTQDLPFVPQEIGDGVAVFADGRRVALLECDGPPTALLDTDGQRAAHAGAHEFLQGLATPLQVEVALTPVDLSPYAAARAARLPGLPLDLRRLESADIAFMRSEARCRGLLPGPAHPAHARRRGGRSGRRDNSTGNPRHAARPRASSGVAAPGGRQRRRGGGTPRRPLRAGSRRAGGAGSGGAPARHGRPHGRVLRRAPCRGRRGAAA